MKIASFETFVVGTPPPHYGGRYFLFVKLVSTDGIIGYGECYSATFSPHLTAKLIEDLAERYLVGHDPHDISAFMRRVYSSGFSQRPDPTAMAAASALEIACWDIIGKGAGKPVYKLLGGAVQTRLRCYTYLYPEFDDEATASVYPDEAGVKNVYNDPELAAKAALHCVNQGFTAVKFDPAGPYTAFDGHQPRLSDISLSHDMVMAVRDAIGDRADILFGTHGQFTAAGARRLAEAIKPADPLWFEEPVPPDNVAAMAEVAHNVSIAVATGERLTSKAEFSAIIAARAAAILQPNTGRSGGILETRHIAAMAEPHHIQIAPHCYCGPFVAAANMHVAASSPNFLILEAIRQFDGFYADVLTTPITFESGFAIMSNEPGLGIALNEDIARAHPYHRRELHLEMQNNPLWP